MTDAEFWVYMAALIGLWATTIVGTWLCFRRTRLRSFFFLAAVALLWPLFDAGTDALTRHFVQQVMAGKSPWLFPFSLMVSGHKRWNDWQMSPGEFITKLSAAKQVLFLSLLAAASLLVARSFRPKQP